MPVSPLLGPVGVHLLGEALQNYTVDGLYELVGPVGRAALERGDLAGLRRALPADESLATLVRLFLLGDALPAATVRHALRPLDPAGTGDLLDSDGDLLRSRVEVRPYSADGIDRWVVSDFGSDVRPGPLAPDHVLGVGSASLTLAQAVPRQPVGAALDLGTGCGIQALHLSEHAGPVVATDVSARALRMAATTAALCGKQWDLRAGSLLDPVAGESFDLIVSNPPFVVSPGFDTTSGGHEYRDSGLAGDEVCDRLLRTIPLHLAPGGCAVLLANWVVPADGDWAGRVTGWLDGSGCEAWVWQREVADPGSYVSLWLRDAGHVPGTAEWVARYDVWCDWFDARSIAAVGMGMVALWRSPDGVTDIVCEDVPQAYEQPIGGYLPPWVHRRRWLRAHDDAAVLGAALRLADGVVHDRQELRDDQGWRVVRDSVRQSTGLRWEVEVDDAMAGLLAASDGKRPLALLLGVLAAATGSDADALTAAALPVVRDLITRGILIPEDS